MELETTLALDQIIQSVNVATLLTDKDLSAIGALVCEEFERDKQEREEWEKRMEDAHDLVMQLRKAKSWPWPNASNVRFPLISVAALQFHARAFPALINADLVKFKDVGSDPQGEKRARGERISTHIRYQMLGEDETWQEEMDTLLISVPIMGCEFKMTYVDELQGRVRSDWVSCWDLVIPYRARSVADAQRKTRVLHLAQRTITERQRAGIYVDVKIEGDTKSALKSHEDRASARVGVTAAHVSRETDGPRDVLEQHRFLDLDGDGYPEPYCVTVDYASQKVLRIYRRFEPENVITEGHYLIKKAALAATRGMAAMAQSGDEEGMAAAQQIGQAVAAQLERIRQAGKIVRIIPTEHFTKYSFLPSPDGGIYDLGFGALLSPINESVNSLINQLIDAGTLANGSRGFLGRGARLKSGSMFFEPFEWKTVNVAGGPLRENIVPLPVQPPSAVLFNMLTLLISYGERLASTTDLMAGETPGQNTPASTSSNALEQGMKVFASAFKRLHRGFTSEIRKFYFFNRHYLDFMEYAGLLDLDPETLKADYFGDPRDVVPAADPTILSPREKNERAAFLASRAASVPGYNLQAVEKRLLDTMEVEDTEAVYPTMPGTQIPPPENPELQLKGADIARKTLESQAREKANSIKSAALLAETEAKIALYQIEGELKLAEAAKLGVEADAARIEPLLRLMAEHRESLRLKLEADQAEQERADARESAAAAAE